MAHPEHGTVEHLAEVLAGCQEEIISEWRVQARQLLHALHLDKPTITDHLPDVVAEIVQDLQSRRDGPLSAEHRRGSPPVHGVQRYHDGLDVGEVVAEYSLLRNAFLTVARRHDLSMGDEAAHIINHRIDEAVRMAVLAFAAQQALMRKEQEDAHLAFVVHDLRTPLNAITLLVEEVKEMVGAPAREEAKDAFEVLGRNLSRLETLVKRMLTARLPESGVATSFQPELRDLELWPLVQRLIMDLAAVSGKDDIEVINAVPKSLSMTADAGLISQVFQNLLGNAFKYAARGKVTVSASAGTGAVTCVVADNGAGIPFDILTKVFDRNTTDPAKEGTGLGLAIVKEIVEAHGGTIIAESVHGAGAKFSFTIPVSNKTAS